MWFVHQHIRLHRFAFVKLQKIIEKSCYFTKYLSRKLLEEKISEIYGLQIHFKCIDYRAQHQMTREIVKELDSKLFITLDGYDELVKQQGFASTWRKFKAAQEQTKQE